jgi:hypothetical protein
MFQADPTSAGILQGKDQIKDDEQHVNRSVLYDVRLLTESVKTMTLYFDARLRSLS